jgi:ABC-type dipeptide/oligopeptide/nickel transport system ATPase subunit
LLVLQGNKKQHIDLLVIQRNKKQQIYWLVFQWNKKHYVHLVTIDTDPNLNPMQTVERFVSERVKSLKTENN